MKIYKSVQVFFLALFFLLWFGGLLTYFGMLPPTSLATYSAPLFLFVAHLIMIFSFPKTHQVWLILVFILGLTAEIVGLKTGWIFGHYNYTSILGISVFGTPLAIGSAWVILAGFTRHWLSYYDFSVLNRIILSSLIMVSIDLVLDPVAANTLNFWSWHAPGAYYNIPTQNFLGWFLVSLVIFSLSPKNKTSHSTLGLAVGWLIILFFTLLALFFGLIAPGIIGVVLVVLSGRQFLPKLTASVLQFRAWSRHPHKLN